MPDALQMPCPACGVTNRVPREKLAHIARCGKCGAELPPMVHPPLAVDSPDFDSQVRRSPLPVLVDFWAPWCGPCRALAPSLEGIAREYEGRLRVVKVNTDENQSLAREFQIMSIPTMILFDGGDIRNQISGALPPQQLRNWINRSMGWL